MERKGVSIRLSGEAVRKMKERVAQSSLIEELIHLDHRNHILGTTREEEANA